jgi:hypothetical protein
METRAPVVARGAWYGWRLPSLAAAACAGALVLVSIVALATRHVPWSIEGSDKLFAGAPPVLSASIVVFALAAAYSLAKSVFIARAGRVVIDDDGVVLKRGLFRRTRVAWSELEAYSDASSGRVDLVKKGESFARPKLAIPTRSDETHAAVLAALDAHGLRRIEVSSRGRRLARAAIAGAGALLVLFAVLHVANARYRKFEELANRRLPPADTAALLSETVSIRYVVRPVIGAEDGICLEIRPVVLNVPGILVERSGVFVHLTTQVELDGKSISKTRSTLNSDSGDPFSFYDPVNHFPYGDVVRSSARGLAPGRHELHLISSLKMVMSNGECVKESRIPIEIVEGSLAEKNVKLVRGIVPDFFVEVDPRAERLEIGVNNDLPRALAARMECLEGEKVLVSDTLFWRAQRGPISEFHSDWYPKLSPGRHVLKVRLTPDPKSVYQNSNSDVTEILGETFEREVVVDVP